MILGSTEKFTGKAEVYALARQGYPKQLIDLLYKNISLSESSSIADIGSGTGKFSIELLKRGSKVFCIEPNDDMRSIAERNFAEYPDFYSIKGTSEYTGLEANSVDCITVAQAFHWFDADKFKTECRRILKDHGFVVLVWNMRADCEFNSRNGEIFEKYCTEFRGFSSEKRDRADVEKFFDGRFERVVFENSYSLEKVDFIARCESTSYSLPSNHADYCEYIRELEALFDKYSVDGRIEIPSETVAYIGHI